MKETFIKLNTLKYSGSIVKLIDKFIKESILSIRLDDYSKLYKIELFFEDIRTFLTISIENKDSLAQAYATSQVRVLQDEQTTDPIFIFSTILIIQGEKDQIKKSISDLTNSLNEFLELILSDYDKFTGSIRMRMYEGISDEKVSFTKYEYDEKQIFSESMDEVMDMLNNILIDSPTEKRFKIETIFNVADHTTITKTLLVYKTALMNGQQAFQSSGTTKINDDCETYDIMLASVDDILGYIDGFLYVLDRVYIKGTDSCKLNLYIQV